MKGFLNFIRSQGVMGLAVGFLLGGAVGDLVKSLMVNVVNPLLGILLNQAQGITDASVIIVGADIKYGALFITLTNFFVIAAVVYFGVKGLGLDKIDKKD
ncbi:MAG: MscL family protein [Candidatus Paceibacterota bacterium]|jgi:large conductance mechanosensitive channel